MAQVHASDPRPRRAALARALLRGTAAAIVILVLFRATSQDLQLPYDAVFVATPAAFFLTFAASMLYAQTRFESLSRLLAAEEEDWRRLIRYVSLIAPSLVRPILFMTGAFILYLVYELTDFDRRPFVKVALIGICAIPMLLTLCATLLVERRFAHSEYKIETSADVSQEMRAEVAAIWEYESEHMRESVQRMARHGGILGFIGTAFLSGCIVLTYQRGGPSRYWLEAVAVGSAVTVSFALHLGKILFRSASNDATARMMAWAARTLLIVGIATVLFTILLLRGGASNSGATQPIFAIQEVPGALIVGVAVALVGERILKVVTDRAVSILGIAGGSQAGIVDLSSLDGLNEEDLSRLAEERVDSVHALAYISTPHLFLNTVYTLERICEWQNQALLIARLGKTNAQVLRDKFQIRGATAAQDIAIHLVKHLENVGGGGVAGEQSNERSKADTSMEELARALGFGQLKDAYFGLKALAGDRSILRLRAFIHSRVVWEGEHHTEDPSQRGG